MDLEIDEFYKQINEFDVFHEVLDDRKSTLIHIDQKIDEFRYQRHSILVLTDKGKFLFYGKAKIHINITTNVLINGSVLKKDTPHEIKLFSPTTHAPLSIEILEFCDNIQTKAYFPLSQGALEKLDDFLAAHNNPSMLIYFGELDDPRLDSLMRISKFTNLFSFESTLAQPKLSAFTLHHIDPRDIGGFQMTEEMWKALEMARKSKVILIAGPKNAGKSSFLRTIFNTLVNHSVINFMDCDIGQPEFTLSGFLSYTRIKRQVFGPPFTHQLESDDSFNVERQCFYGTSSPSDDPIFYLQCLKFLYEKYQTDNTQDSEPFLINTMGWTQNLGLTLLLEQIRLFQPDLIIQLEIENASHQNLPILTKQLISQHKDFHGRFFTCDKKEHKNCIIKSYSRLCSLSERDVKFSKTHRSFGAADHRDLMLMTTLLKRFSHLPRSLPNPSICQDPFVEHPVDSLLSIIPYRVPIALAPERDTIQLGIVSLQNVCNQEREIKILDMLNVFSASLVALISVPESRLKKSLYSNPAYRTVEEKPVAECLGIGVVRAVDVNQFELMIITDLDQQTLAKVNLIVRGHINLPSFYFTEQPVIRHNLFTQNFCFPPHVTWFNPNQSQNIIGNSTIPQKRQYPKTKNNTEHASSGTRALD